MEIHDIDGILIVDRNPFGKGGPGSGRYPAGSSGNTSSGGGGGEGGAGGEAPSATMQEIGKQLDEAVGHVNDAEEAMEEGNVKGARNSVNDAYDSIDKAVDMAKPKLTDNESVKIEQLRSTIERNLDKADDEMLDNASQYNPKLTSALNNAIDQIGMIENVLSGVAGR